MSSLAFGFLSSRLLMESYESTILPEAPNSVIIRENTQAEMEQVDRISWRREPGVGETGSRRRAEDHS